MRTLVTLSHAIFFRILVSMQRLGIRRLFRLSRLDVARLSPHNAPPSELLMPAEAEVRASNVPGERPFSSRAFPAVCFREFSNVLVTANPRVSALVSGNLFLIPESSPDGPWQIVRNNPPVGGLLARHGDSILLMHRKHPALISRGIFVGSWSPHNWYHWVVDTLPAVALAAELPEKYDDFPLLLPDVVFGKPNFLEIATKLAGGRELLPLPSDYYLSVGRLVWMDGATSPGPPSRKSVDGALFSAHRSALQYFRAAVVDAYGMSKVAKRFRRVFIARKDNTERPFNQGDLVNISLEEGLEVVYLEDLSVEESIRIFLEAKLVVGAHGAGWANGLFLGPRSRAVLLMGEAFRHHNWFVNILAVVGAEFDVIFGASLESKNSNWFHIEPNDFRALLRK